MKKANIFIRTFTDLWPVAGRTFILSFIWSIFKFSVPFINYIYMGQALTILYQGQFEEVYSLIIQYLFIFAVFQLIAICLEPIKDYQRTETMRKINTIPNEKMLTMNFHFADNSETQGKLVQINRDQNTNNSSFNMIFQHTNAFINNVISFILALVILNPLWNRRGPTIEGYEWVNSPWVNVAIIFLVIIVLLSHSGFSMWAMMQLGKSSQAVMRGNNTFYYYIKLLTDVESGKEARLYHIHEYVEKKLLDFLQWSETFFKMFYRGMSKATLSSKVGAQLINWLVYLLIGIKVLAGALPVGMVVQLIGAMSQLLQTLEYMLSFFTLFTQSEPQERFYELMDLPDELDKGSIPIEKRLDNQYHLSIRNLSFSYPNSEQKILNDISQDFEIGKHYAIVGENGSGKTTFIKVLMRLYEPSFGKVMLNEIDGDKYSLNEFYQLFSVVFQDFRLLGLSIGENISVSPDYDFDRVIDTLDKVGLARFVNNLTHGIETNLGTEYDKDGVNISGGQAQKIALARALYKDAPVVILDEPTAALDPVAEFEIYQKFSQIVENKTAFYISHRLSSCRFCDEILVFDQGQIIQRGSHQVLVNQPGKYQDLWQAQAQYYQ